MSTSYTNELVSKNLSFKDFTLLCARSIGYLSRLREESLNKPIPEKFNPNPYYSKQIETYKKELKYVKTRTNPKNWAKKEILKKIKELEELCNEKEAIEIYENMLEKVSKWVPPSKDHETLKKVMIDQLTDVIKESKEKKYAEEEIVLLKSTKYMDYYNQEISRLEKCIKYNQDALNKDIEQTNIINNWLKELRESLDKFQP